MPVLSEKRTEDIARELLEVRGWETARPPRGQVLWKNEYREYDHLRKALASRSKTATGPGFPDFIVVDEDIRPVIVGEAKAAERDVTRAVDEAAYYADALLEHGYPALSVGVAGTTASELAVLVKKRSPQGWKEIQYRGNPIQWVPTPEQARALLLDGGLFDLQPQIPSEETLARHADEINRILRECAIKDEYRPAVIAAFMLGLAQSGGNIRTNPEHVLVDINTACRKAFERAGKYEIAESIRLPQENTRLSARAVQIVYILRLLNVTTLTSAHDYLGQLYETFFRYTGKNTIGQVFTPRHITNFMADLCEVSANDYVVDPTCGTGGFLIAALYRMIGNRNLTKAQISRLVSDHLIGFETEPITAALCVANMILRGDGTTAVVTENCFTSDKYPDEEATLVLGNPPFPHKSTDAPPENFINRGLEALQTRGRLAMVVPNSMLVKRDKAEWRKSVLRRNTLEAVIELPSELFQPYASSTTAIVVLKKGIPHRDATRTFFCHVSNDGYRLKKSVRVYRPGSQLPAALTAFQARDSVPGLCSFETLQGFGVGAEWAPGAYIEAEEHSFDDLADEITGLIQEHIAFHARHAKELSDFSEALAAGDFSPRPYREIVGRDPVHDATPNTIGSLFAIYYGQKELHSKEHLISGNALVISSKGADNGCYGFRDFENLIAPPFVTVPSTGSIGEASVQTFPCGVTDDCLLLIPLPGTGPEDWWIAAATVRLERWRFNYGRKITPERIKGLVLSRDERLMAHVRRQLESAAPYLRGLIRFFAKGAPPPWGGGGAAAFGGLATRWKDETSLLSNVTKKAMHPAYQRIIGMGEAVVPQLLADLQGEQPPDWFWALTSITGENPITEEIAGDTKAMAEAWIRWGKAKGYLNDLTQTSSENSPTSSSPDTP